MARPEYETEADRQIENDVSQIVSKAWNCKLTKLPVKYHLDYAVVRNEVIIGFLELKSRNYTMAQLDRMGGFFVSLDKFMSAQRLNKATGLPSIIMIKALDGIYYASFHNAKIKSVKMEGRKDRKDWQDVEPCVLLATDQFKLFQKK